MPEAPVRLAAIGESLRLLAGYPGLDVEWWADPQAARADLGRDQPDHIMLELDGGDDLSGLKEVMALTPQASVVVVCRRERLDSGRAALEVGAQDLLALEDLTPAMVGHALDAADRVKRIQSEHSDHRLDDPLTGLPSRTLLDDRLEMALARSEREGSSVAMVFLGLDRFGLINEAVGYRAGDAVLAQVAMRLSSAIRATDTVARTGGDVFCVLCEEITDQREAMSLVQRISDALAAPFRLADRELYVTVSAGVATSSGIVQKPEVLIGEAEAAMWRAKANGRARCEVADEDAHSRFLRRVADEDALQRGLDRQEFRLHYQPIFRLSTGEITGVEALLRWERPEHGLLGPEHFLELAEATGMIVPIGAWVLRDACMQSARWRAQRPDAPPLCVAVNLSLRQFTQPNLVDLVLRSLQETGTDPGELALEITETIVLEDKGARVAALVALSELGVPLAIDDFGTGYASLCWLKRFPANILKIDRSFVSGLPGNQNDSAIVSALVDLAHALGLSAVAEGVETAEQHQELRAMGCDQAQGFHLAMPQPAEAIDTLLAGTPQLR